MSLKPRQFPDVPEGTRRVAEGALPRGCFCMTIRDEVGVVYQDVQFQSLFSSRG